MKWLIEPYEKQCEEIIQEIRRQGHSVEFVEYYSLAHNQDTRDSSGKPYSKANYPERECVLFQGTIQCAQWLLRNKPWIPTLWLTEKNYRCSEYYPKLQRFLFNDSFIFVPRGCFMDLLDSVIKPYIVDNCTYCRPDSGLKPFGGMVLELWRGGLERQWAWVENFTQPSDFILVSNPKTIQEEYRFICAEGREIVAASKYKSRYVLDVSIAVPEAARIKCQEILDTGFCPDPMFVLDLCKGADNNYYLLEVNAFSTAGLYDCDLKAVVAKASEIAWKKNQEYWRETLSS